MNQAPLKYVLITPARNEEAFIEKTILSVVRQTVRPVKWVIVSDGSTDNTDTIVGRYAAEHPWIELVRMPQRSTRHFGAKVASFEAGYQRVQSIDFDIVGSLDADISFEDEYFASLLQRFAENRKLGVAGTPFSEGNGTYDFRFSSTEHVSGACQLFRRECYAAIGGYAPLSFGGIDVVAVLTARMKGWQTKTFLEMTCIHHRPMGSANHGRLKASFRLGQKDYMLGRHPLWQVMRSFYQMARPPFLVGGLMLLGGFSWAAVRRLERPVTPELIRFQRREQMQRLRRVLPGLASPRS